MFDGIYATQNILLTLEDITNLPGTEPFTQKKDAREGGPNEKRKHKRTTPTGTRAIGWTRAPDRNSKTG
jgi:hypothetical protein